MATDPYNKQKLRAQRLAEIASQRNSGLAKGLRVAESLPGIGAAVGAVDDLGGGYDASLAEEESRLRGQQQAEQLRAQGRPQDAVRLDGSGRVAETTSPLDFIVGGGLGLRAGARALMGARNAAAEGGLNRALAGWGGASSDLAPGAAASRLGVPVGAQAPKAGLRAANERLAAGVEADSAYPIRPRPAPGTNPAAPPPTGIRRAIDAVTPGRKTLVGGGVAAGVLGLTAMDQNNAAQAVQQDGAGGPSAAPPPAAQPSLRQLTVGRGANGQLLASSEGPQDVAGLAQAAGDPRGRATGLRTISFKPETDADVKKAQDASAAFEKNIGGGLAAQQDALSSALADEAGGGAGAARGLRGASRSGAGDTPLDFAKFGLDAKKFGLDVDKANAERTDAISKEQRDRTDKRAQEYISQLGDNVQPGDYEDAQLLSSIDRLKEKDPNLFDTDNEATRPTRENLQQRATDLINKHFERYTTNDPNQPISPKVGSADLSGFGKGSYRGGLKALVPDFVNDFGGSFTYTDQNGETYYANADELNPVQLEILQRAAALGGKDKAVKSRE